MDWEGIFAETFPLQQMLTQALQKFNQTKFCTLILVALFWPKQTWFIDLQTTPRNNQSPFPPML